MGSYASLFSTCSNRWVGSSGVIGGINLTLNGTPTLTTDRFGLPRCYDLNGSSQYLTATISQTIKSICGWINPDSTTLEIIDLDGGTHYISATAGTLSTTGFSTPTIYVNGVSTTTLGSGSWQFITATTATGFSASSISIGKRSTSYGDGKFGEFALFTGALTAAEVLGMYQTITKKPLQNPHNLRAYWGV